MLNKVENIIVTIASSIFIICIGIAITTITKSCAEKPQNKKDDLDSINARKENLDKDVKQLDSIKNAKIISIKELSNDSTILLFYELIRK